MAVVVCKECGGKVSTKADSCPSCGAKQKKGVGVLGWLLAIFVVLPIAWSIGSGMEGEANSGSGFSAPQRSATLPKEVEVVTAKWAVSEYIDPMTDQQTTTASMKSVDGANFAFPYEVRGGSKLTMTFRKKAGGELDAILNIEKGNMLCSSYKCQFNLRIAEDPVQRWTGLPSATHDSDIMFVRDAEALEKIIKTGLPIRIGIEFFQAGEHVFTFNTSDYPGL